MDKRYNYNPKKDGPFEQFLLKILTDNSIPFQSMGYTDINQNDARNEDPIHKVGECFKRGDHYYQQRINDTLHVNTEAENMSINVVEVNYLNIYTEIDKIGAEEFKLAVQKVIYDMDINSFWKNL